MRAGCPGTADRVVNNQSGSVVRVLCAADGAVVIDAAPTGATGGAALVVVVGCAHCGVGGTPVSLSFVGMVGVCAFTAGTISECARLRRLTCLSVVRRKFDLLLGCCCCCCRCGGGGGGRRCDDCGCCC